MKLSVITGLACMAAALAMEVPSPTIVYDNTDVQTNDDGYNTQFLKEHLDGQSGGGSNNRRREISRSRRVPSGCSSSAIAGNCSNCNGNGCDAFRCSAFTTWSCPSGYSQCGSETCVGGLCAAKIWCDAN